MENDERQPAARDIEVFIPESVELIDHRHASHPRQVYREARPLRSRRRLALFLFLATCASTFFLGAINTDPKSDPGLLDYLRNGINYAGPLMLILSFHEMGHYLQARRYGVPATLPYFIPMPAPPFGTMGAVIVQGAGVANRKQMFDIAISGPLAGLILAIPIAYYGLTTSQVVSINSIAAEKITVFGEPLILQWMAHLVFPNLEEGQGIMQSPMAFAGWVGIFITALNLIPIGQLDGGHILYMLIRRRAHTVAMLVLGTAVAFMIFTQNFSYLLIVVLLMVFGPRHPPTADDNVPLGWPRIVLGWLTLAFIFIGFTPTPMMEMDLKGTREKVIEPERPLKERVDPDNLVHATEIWKGRGDTGT